MWAQDYVQATSRQSRGRPFFEALAGLHDIDTSSRNWASMDGPGPVRLASVATDGRRPSAPVVARPAPVREADDGDGTRGEAPAAAWTASSTAEEEAWTMSRSRSNTVG